MNTSFLYSIYAAIMLQLRRRLKRDRKIYSELDAIREILFWAVPREGTMIDVGAQFGESFLPFRKAGWTILAFEPDPDPRKQSSLNGFIDSNTTVKKIAIGDAVCESKDFFTSPESTGISALSAFRETHVATAKVAVSTLCVELHGWAQDHVDFLKIDTEGHDYFVLRGFPWENSALHPRVVMCEFEDSKTRTLNYVWSEMAEFLRLKGYHVYISEWYPIERYGIQHRWRTLAKYPATLKDVNGWGNIVAFKHSFDAEKFVRITQTYFTS